MSSTVTLIMYPMIMPFWCSQAGGIHISETEWEVISTTVMLPGEALGTEEENCMGLVDTLLHVALSREGLQTKTALSDY